MTGVPSEERHLGGAAARVADCIAARSGNHPEQLDAALLGCLRSEILVDAGIALGAPNVGFIGWFFLTIRV